MTLSLSQYLQTFWYFSAPADQNKTLKNLTFHLYIKCGVYCVKIYFIRHKFHFPSMKVLKISYNSKLIILIKNTPKVPKVMIMPTYSRIITSS